MSIDVEIRNGDGKIWILPQTNLKTALCIYQPSSKKGNIIKCYLPQVIIFYPILKHIFNKIGITKIIHEKEELVENYINSIIPCGSELEFSYFLGTPSIHQKKTIQIYCNEKILAYCKTSDSNEIFSLFQHEKKVLNYLHYNGIENVPVCLACDRLIDGTYIFVQSTNKTGHSRVKHVFSKTELTFLKNMVEKTSIHIDYAKTDYAVSVNSLKKRLSLLQNNGYSIDYIIQAIDLVEHYCSTQNSYCFCHRDFTPWNMYYNDGELFVFDFEYARFEYPPYIDAVHYFMQTSIFEKKMHAKEIYDEFFNDFVYRNIDGLIEYPKQLFLSYLVDIISLYVVREQEQFSGDVKRNMDIWMQLCEITIKELEEEVGI